MVLCESIPTLGGPVLMDDTEAPMPVLMDEDETKTVAEQDEDWYIRNEKRMAGLRAAEADWNRRNKRK